MKTLYLLFVVCLASSVFGAPPNIGIRIPAVGNFWDFQSSMLDDFEANLRRMREEFDQLEKSLESGFKFSNVDETGVRVFQNGTNIFSLDPTKVKNESFSDTKIVDDKVVHTEEKVIANGNSVVHFKKVEITPKLDKPKKTTFNSAAPPSIPEATTPGSSKNDLDSEQVDHDDNGKSPEASIFGETPRDVEEIESSQPAALRAPPVNSDLPNDLEESDLVGSSANTNPSSVVDLTGDTKVNDILSQNIESGDLIQPEPEAELIELNTNSINRPNNAVDKSSTNENSDNSNYSYYGYVV